MNIKAKVLATLHKEGSLTVDEIHGAVESDGLTRKQVADQLCFIVREGLGERMKDGSNIAYKINSKGQEYLQRTAAAGGTTPQSAPPVSEPKLAKDVKKSRPKPSSARAAAGRKSPKLQKTHPKTAKPRQADPVAQASHKGTDFAVACTRESMLIVHNGDFLQFNATQVKLIAHALAAALSEVTA